MRQFDPTRPPAGRLARLGVLIDPSRSDHESVARFCDLAGIDMVWLASRDGGPAADPWSVAAALAGSLRRVRIGVVTDTPDIPAGTAVAEVAVADASRAVEIDDVGPHDGSGRSAHLRVDR